MSTQNHAETLPVGASIPDRRKLVSLVATLLICVCAGLGYAWSVFQNPIVEHFPDWGTSAVSFAFTLQVSLSALAPLLFGNIFSKMPTKQVVFLGGVFFAAGLTATSFMSSVFMLYLFYGVFAGIGVGMIYTTLMTYSVSLYPHKKGLMSGITAASYGSGAILWAPVANSLIARYNVLITYRILGILFFVVVLPLTLLLVQVQKDEKKAPSGGATSAAATPTATSKDKTRADMVRMPIFYITVLMVTLGVAAGLMMTGYSSPILQTNAGFSAAQAAAIVGFLAVSNTCGRLLWGTIADKFSIYLVVATLFLITIAAMFLMAVLPAMPMVFVVLMILVYLCYGGFATVIAPIAADLFGMKNLTSNYGLMYVAYGIAGIVGPRIAATFQGLAPTAQLGYAYSFYVSAGLCLIGFLLNLYVMRQAKRL